MRSFVSLFLFYALGLTGLTGLVLYIMPPGRVAYWTDWRLLGLGKDQWEAIHILFGVLVIFLAAWHFYLNWKPFKRYLGSTRAPSKVLVSLTLITVALTVLAIKDLPPASLLMSLQERFEASWHKPAVPPPVPHAELLSLEAIVKREGLSLPKTMQVLEARGFKIPSSQMSLKELARLNKTSPADLYLIIITQKQSPFTARGSGAPVITHPGKRTLKEVCELFGLDRKTCEGILKKHGVRPDWNSPLRELAFSHGVTPWDIMKWLRENR